MSRRSIPCVVLVGIGLLFGAIEASAQLGDTPAFLADVSTSTAWFPTSPITSRAITRTSSICTSLGTPAARHRC